MVRNPPAFAFSNKSILTCHQTIPPSILWIVHEPKPTTKEVISERYGCHVKVNTRPDNNRFENHCIVPVRG
ncbi:hypothetical protein ACVLD2_001768 [Paenibacillus sp. PvR052]|nr:hypothetical protein [Paenibacillus sp. PvP091]MBP1170287.1 hypothetical protein [Paenibacillus sp. PvR098]MBP2441315.1 hypothetical protein [Paenibacillus sp. PvP052]